MRLATSFANFLHFCSSNLPSLLSEKKEITYSASGKPVPADFPTSQDGLLYPDLNSVKDMKLEQIADILKLHYPPNLETWDSHSLIRLIAENVYYGPRSVSKEEMNHRKQLNYRFLRSNQFVLSSFARDERLMKYFGFGGCLRIVEGCLIKLAENKPKKNPYLDESVSNLEEFFETVLDELVPPYRLSITDTGYSRTREVQHYSSYYERAVAKLYVDDVFETQSIKLYQVLLKRFAPWLGGNVFFNFLKLFRKNLHKVSYNKIRSFVTSLASLGPVDAFCSETLIPDRYFVNANEFGNGDNDDEDVRELKKSCLYTQMVPLLRALMLVDNVKHTKSYLAVYNTQMRSSLIDENTETFALFVLDSMIADSEFIYKAQSNREHAEDVLNSIAKVFSCKRIDLLIGAIKLDLLNLAEACLMFTPLTQLEAHSLIGFSITNLCYLNHVEIFAILIAYSPLSSTQLEDLSNEIDLETLYTKIQWDDQDSIFMYNRFALGKMMLTQSADILKEFTDSRTVEASYLGERIQLPCPMSVLESLHPTLFLYRNDMIEHGMYPNFSVINLGQVLLYRVFKIPFSISRTFEDCSESFAWTEVIEYLNFILYAYAQKLGLDDFIVKFHDLIDEKLRKRGLSEEEYGQEYLAALNELELTEDDIFSDCLSDDGIAKDFLLEESPNDSAKNLNDLKDGSETTEEGFFENALEENSDVSTIVPDFE